MMIDDDTLNPFVVVFCRGAVIARGPRQGETHREGKKTSPSERLCRQEADSFFCVPRQRRQKTPEALFGSRCACQDTQWRQHSVACMPRPRKKHRKKRGNFHLRAGVFRLFSFWVFVSLWFFGASAGKGCVHKAPAVVEARICKCLSTMAGERGRERLEDSHVRVGPPWTVADIDQKCAAVCRRHFGDGCRLRAHRPRHAGVCRQGRVTV